MKTLVTYAFVLSAILTSPSSALAEQHATESEESSGVEAVVVQLLMQSLADSIEGNIQAADRENGELAKLVRALTGVSVKDIEAHGICGGENSELRKILGNDVCGDI